MIVIKTQHTPSEPPPEESGRPHPHLDTTGNPQ